MLSIAQRNVLFPAISLIKIQGPDVEKRCAPLLPRKWSDVELCIFIYAKYDLLVASGLISNAVILPSPLAHTPRRHTHSVFCPPAAADVRVTKRSSDYEAR